MTEALAPSRRSPAVSPSDAGTGFEAYDPEFEAVLGSAPRLALVAETDAHEGPVYVPGEDALYFTTVPQAAEPPQAGEPRAAIRRLALDGCSFPVDPSRLSTLPVPVHMPNGMALGHDGRPGIQPGRGPHRPGQPARGGQLHLWRPRPLGAVHHYRYGRLGCGAGHRRGWPGLGRTRR